MRAPTPTRVSGKMIRVCVPVHCRAAPGAWRRAKHGRQGRLSLQDTQVVLSPKWKCRVWQRKSAASAAEAPRRDYHAGGDLLLDDIRCSGPLQHPRDSVDVESLNGASAGHWRHPKPTKHWRVFPACELKDQSFFPDRPQISQRHPRRTAAPNRDHPEPSFERHLARRRIARSRRSSILSHPEVPRPFEHVEA
jgi:hypothetical protein